MEKSFGLLYIFHSYFQITHQPNISGLSQLEEERKQELRYYFDQTLNNQTLNNLVTQFQF